MKYKNISCLLMMLCLTSVTALNCRFCTQSKYEGNPDKTNDCFDNAANVGSVSCISGYYCQIKLTVEDGLPASISRDCASPASDQDQSTNAMPSSDQCTTGISTNPDVRDRTICYYSCNDGDNCNRQTGSILKPCASNCSEPTAQGYCDYISKNCVCRSGWTGQNCEIKVTVPAPKYRKCLQCNDDENPSCKSGNGISSTQCPGSTSIYNYCVSSRTVSLDRDGEEARTIVTRGCSGDYMNRCGLTDTSDLDKLSEYTEYTCSKSCDTDGCNTDTDFSSVSEKTLLRCGQCSDLTGNGFCNSAPLRDCPLSSTHCKSTVSYFISNRDGYVDPSSYHLLSVVRECADSAVTTQCKSETTNSIDVQKVTCQETCQLSGCNYNKWPARPFCSSCSSNTPFDENDACVNAPLSPQRCPQPYFEYCYVAEINKDNVKGYPASFQRGCSSFNLGSSCDDIDYYGQKLESCNRTCTTDGCNLGSGSSTLQFDFLMTLLPTTLLYLFKFM